MQLHPFQTRGAEFLSARRHAYLADEMGLGKTPQAVFAAAQAGARRVLVLCPAIVCAVWQRIAENARPGWLPTHVVGSGALPAGDALVICSYDRAVLRRDELRRRGWDALICDEAHYLKNPTTGRSRVALNAIYGGKGSFSAVSGATWLLSGTPMPLSPVELWPALRTAGITEQRYWDFAYRFCYVHEDNYGRKAGSARDPAALRALLDGYLLRRLTADVLPELPPLAVTTLEVPGAEIDVSNPVLPQLRALDAAAHDAIVQSIERGDWLMQHVPHIATIRRLTGLAKAHHAAAQAHAELALEMCQKIVLFGIHTDALNYLARELRHFEPALLLGGMTERARTTAVERFQSDPRCRVAIGQIRAAGAGITLTAADRLIIFEPSWSPADNEQAIKRVHRIGQLLPTHASFLSLAGSTDQKVTAALTSRIRTAKQILDAPLASTV